MNKIERVTAALRGEEVDRLPASFWFHFPAEKAAGEAMARVHLDYYRRCNVDFLKVMNDNGYDLPSGVTQITEPSQWRDIDPAPLSARCFQNELDGLRIILDELRNECLSIVTVFSPYAVANKLCGKKLSEHIKEDPAAVRQGLDTIAASLGEFAKACVEAGAAGIFLSSQGGEADRFDDAEFNNIIKATDIAVLNAVKDATFNLLHICAWNVPMHRYTDYPATAVNWSTQWDNISLTQGREIFDCTIIGGVDQRGAIVSGDRDALRLELQAAAAEGGNRNFMIGAGCTLPNEIDQDNIRFAMDCMD